LIHRKRAFTSRITESAQVWRDAPPVLDHRAGLRGPERAIVREAVQQDDRDARADLVVRYR
jgi:hypothetical protein